MPSKVARHLPGVIVHPAAAKNPETHQFWVAFASVHWHNLCPIDLCLSGAGKMLMLMMMYLMIGSVLYIIQIHIVKAEESVDGVCIVVFLSGVLCCVLSLLVSAL